MSEESKNDVVKADDQIAMIEARLADLTGLCGDHSCVFGPPKGLGTNGGCRCEVKRNPKVKQAIQLQRKLSTLLRERVKTQAESITTFQSQFRVMKEAIEAAIPWLTMEIKERECGTHDQPTHCVDCQLRHKAQAIKDRLRAAITPKGSEQ